MDKKNTTIGIVLILSAIGLLFWNSTQQPAPVSLPRPPVVRQPDAPVAVAPAPAAAGQTVVPVENLDAGAAKTVVLANDTLQVSLTTRGGGIETIGLLQQADTLEHRKTPAEHPYLFNAEGKLPALALSLEDVATGQSVPWLPEFSVAEEIPGERVTLEAALPGGGKVLRTYAFSSGENSDPHLLKFRTTFKAGDAALPAMSLRMNTGTLPPTVGDSHNQFLGVATYDGDTFHKTGVDMFNPSSGFWGMGARAASPSVLVPRGVETWQWVSVSNQFFAGIIRFDEETRGRVNGLLVTPAMTRYDAELRHNVVESVKGDVGFQLPALQPGQEVALGATYYVGPREHNRLANLGGGQEEVVQFGKLFWVISVAFLCKIFVVILGGLHSLFPDSPWSWGLAIISLTVLIKAITWPLVTTQQRSAERMRQFQGPMKDIREKYKDDPRKMQQEMMKLYQQHKINPFAGCLPVLIQIPIFTGLFFTFQSLAQLRFQSFLWIPDLSMPDVIPGLETIGGFPIHILPVFMGVTMLLNMRLTPMPNVEGQQKMIFYGMMIMFPIICYKMPAALMLYYSVQNCLTIVQTFVTRRRMRNEPQPEPATPAPKSKKTARRKK